MTSRNAMAFTPFMTPLEIAIITRLLEQLPQPVRVLEWGAGNSTIYFADHLRALGLRFSWNAVETNARWHRYVRYLARRQELADIAVHLVDFGGVHPRTHQLPDAVRDRYVEMLRTLGGEFNLVIVDGRYRRRCLQLARAHQPPHGVVFLHDAERGFYLCGEKNSPTGELIQTGIDPFSSMPTQKQAWLGFATPDRRQWFHRAVLGQLDMSALLRQAQRTHAQPQRAVRKWRHKLRYWWYRTRARFGHCAKAQAEK